LAAPNIPGGGGGGGGGAPAPDIFQVLNPTSGFINPLCPNGENSPSQTFEVYNDLNNDMVIKAGFEGVNCQINESAFLLKSKTRYTGTVTSCTCPTDTQNMLLGNLTLTTGTYTTKIPISLYSNILIRLLHDTGFLTKALVIGGIIIILIIAIIIILVNKG
jgi:hypothetical protein